MDRHAAEKRKRGKFLKNSSDSAYSGKPANSLKGFFTITLLSFFFIFNTTGDQVDFFTAGNGLKVILHAKPGLSLISMVFAIDCGSKDETKQNSGQCHLLEHLLLLSATQQHEKKKLIQKIRGKGIEVNAHLDHDTITFELSTPENETEFALELLKEKMFSLAPDAQDLSDEKSIILEEIKQIEDNPIQMGALSVFQLLFQNHSYQYPLYGYKNNIIQAELKDLLKTYSTYLSPSNCSMAIVGDFKFEEMKNRIQHTFGTIKKAEIVPKNKGKPQILKKNREKHIRMDINQAHLFMGFLAPEFNHPDHFAVEILIQILGKGRTPLLAAAVRGKKNLAETFSMRYISLKLGGVILIHATTQPKNLRQLKNQIFKLLKRSNSFRYAREDFLQKERIHAVDYLQSAKNQIKLNSEKFKELGLNRAITYARFMLLKDESKPYNFVQGIKEVHSKDLREMASKYFGGEKCAIVTIVPEKTK